MSTQSPQRRRPPVPPESQDNLNGKHPAPLQCGATGIPLAIPREIAPVKESENALSSPQQPGQALSAQQAQGSPISIQNTVQGPGAQVTRLLPTPPHPLPLPLPMDPEVLHSGGSQHSQSHSGGSPQQQGQGQQGGTVTHYPRPIRMPPAPFLAKYQQQGQGEEERWTMTEELLMDIERADLEAQGGISQQTGQHVNGGHNGTNGSPHIPSQQQQQTHSPHSSLSSSSSMSPHILHLPHKHKLNLYPQPHLPTFSLTHLYRWSAYVHWIGKAPRNHLKHTREEREPSGPRRESASSSTWQRKWGRKPRDSFHKDKLCKADKEDKDRYSQCAHQIARYPSRKKPTTSIISNSNNTQQQQQQHLKHHQLAHHHSQVHSLNQLAQAQLSQGRTPPLTQLAQHASPSRDGDEEVEEGEGDGDGDGEEGSYTPRSPSVSLPEAGMGQGQGPGQGYYTQHLQAHPGLQSYQQQQQQQQQQQNHVQQQQNPHLQQQHTQQQNHIQQQQAQLGRAELTRRSTVTGPADARNVNARGRNGSLDGVVGMRGIEGALLEREREREREKERERERESRERETRDREGKYPPSPLNHRSTLLSKDTLYLDELTSTESSYIQSYLRSPRPEAPVPPTPHSQTGPSPSPYPLPPMLKANSVQGENGDGIGDRPDPSPSPYDLSKDFSPIVPVGSPYPYPFTHVRRVPQVGPNRPHYPSALGGGGGGAALDPTHPQAIQEQMAKQLQMYAQNHNAENGNITDSTFSPASTPFPQGGGYYDPWVYLHMKRTFGGFGGEVASIRSSPSHEPIPLPPAPVLAKARKAARKSSGVVRNVKPPPRVESTQPRETSPELSSSGDETAGEEYIRGVSRGEWNGVVGAVVEGEEDGEGEWVDEDEVDGDEEDLLQLEYHPTFVRNVEKRRRRWESGWETLVQAFRALDRQTDATMVLLASPSHTTKLHTIRSRSIRREAFIAHSSAMREIKRSFKLTSSARRNTRTHTSSLIDRFLASAGNEVSGDSSDGSDKSREEDLKRALETALGSLGTLGSIYEQREARWAEEMRRVREERERVELLLRQVLGDHHAITGNGGGV
ncbi:hypothetical protein BDQ17DRAFT_1527360 [Cyathus striatus]|nr:hypothetical protein BDQ17DRAFT_1527360 [Cyathus striatus]